MLIQTYPPMLPTRPCDFCLALQDDSVFADFKLDEHGRAHLVRISYDGYGCCHPEFNADRGYMCREDTKQLLDLIESDKVQHPDAARILSTFFSQHQDDIWADALRDHELLCDQQGD
jgi:hypothetical protein